MTDLCMTCQQNTTKLQRAPNLSDREKSLTVMAHQDHLTCAQTERAFYRTVCANAEKNIQEIGIDAALNQQLDEKNEECVLLRKQLLDLQQTNNDVAKSQLDREENMYKVSERQRSKMYVLVDLPVHAV